MSRHRAAAILIEDEAVALIERHRDGRHYFVIPGGGVDPGESAEQAVLREVLEELGLRVRIVQPVATIFFRGNRQDYFLVERVSGEFGTGTGPEYSTSAKHGSYSPVWMPLAELTVQPLKPRSMADLILRACSEGWPAGPLTWTEEEND